MSVKIFLVDQSAVARQMLTTLLKKADEEYVVVGESGTGEGALFMLDEDEPDIVVLDLQMVGGMTCSEAVREIKKTRPQTRIILCVNANKKHLVMEASEMGADDFIEKPYHMGRIVRAINHVLHLNEVEAAAAQAE